MPRILPISVQLAAWLTTVHMKPTTELWACKSKTMTSVGSACQIIKR